MKKRAAEISKYILSALFFYDVLNYFRNVFGTPVFYDIFVRESDGKRAVVVIGPYYSLRGFLKSACVCTSSKGLVVARPSVVHDPDKNCLVVLFNLPSDTPDAFNYVIMRKKNKLSAGTHVPEKGKDKAGAAGGNGDKRKLSIATLFKYEVEYLREWIEYHRNVGVEHLYLYENNATPDRKIAAVLAPYIHSGLVTHILWPYPYRFYNYKFRKLWPNDAFAYTQVPQINHALYKFAAETEWLLSCDVDEYFYSPKGPASNGGSSELVSAIDAIRAGQDISSIRVRGFWFGGTSDEVAKAKSAGVLRTFIRSERNPTSACKCIFDTATVRLASVHNSLVHDKREITVSPDTLRFNHYRALGWKKRLDKNFAREVENSDILNS